MAVAVTRVLEILADLSAEAPPAFMQFFGEVCTVPTVHRVGISRDGSDGVTVWVRLSQDNEQNEERIYRALQACRAESPELLIDLHVVFADQPDEVFPKDAIILFTRR